MNPNPYFSPYTKLNCKWIKDCSIGLATLTLLHKEVENIFQFTGSGMDFLDKMLVAQGLKSTTDK